MNTFILIVALSIQPLASPNNVTIPVLIAEDVSYKECVELAKEHKQEIDIGVGNLIFYIPSCVELMNANS